MSNLLAFRPGLSTELLAFRPGFGDLMQNNVGLYVGGLLLAGLMLVAAQKAVKALAA